MLTLAEPCNKSNQFQYQTPSLDIEGSLRLPHRLDLVGLGSGYIAVAGLGYKNP